MKNILNTTLTFKSLLFFYDTLFGNLIIHAQDQVSLDSIVIDTSANILISAPKVNLGDNFSTELNVELEILQEACSNQ